MTFANFPGDSPLPIRGEIFIDGAWTDVTSSIRADREIVISNRGRANEQGRPNPCTVDFTLNDTTGTFNDRNPNSIYYGKLPPYTPIRFSVTEDRSFAIIDTTNTCEVKTTDKAVLDITGDIDVRCEFEFNDAPDGVTGYFLASKYRRTASANRSWILEISAAGKIVFVWSTDGTSGGLVSSNSTEAIDLTGTPLAVRATLDVNDGSGNHVAKFYTSDTISGSWTQLGATVTTAGTTSIFSGTADLELGRIDDGTNGGVVGFTGLYGRIYAFELYNGIAGTLVAEADIYNQPRGTTSFSDGLSTPNTWVTAGTAEITPDNRRFTGEISSLPIEWDVSGNDVYITAQAADITRRLSKGAVPVVSPLTDFFSGLAHTGLWPCEDGTQATTLANKHVGGERGTLTDVQFGTPSDLPATAGSATINSTSSRITLTGSTVTNTGYACFNWIMKMQSIPGSSVTIFDLKLTGGTIGTVNFSVTATNYVLAAYDLDSALLGSISVAWGSTTPPTNWICFRIQLSQSGGNVQVDLGWYHPGDSFLVGSSPLIFAGTAGRFRTCKIVGATNNVGTQFSHFFMGQFFLDNATTEYIQAANAFAGETTAARWLRIGAGNGITTLVVGEDDDCETMSAQPRDTPLNILYDCVDTEQGQGYPDRNSSALILRTHRSLLNQTGPSINYAAFELGPTVPRPVPDDALLRNSVTANRDDGSTGFHEITTGRKGSDSAGVVPASINRNPFADERLDQHAAWDAFLGTWDEDRWTQVMVELARANYTGTAAKIRKGHTLAALDIGDLFSITSPPAWIGPDEIKLMMQGVTEVLGNRTWRLTWNTSPYGPFVSNDFTLRTSTATLVSAGASTLNASLTSSATSFDVATPSTSRPWEVGSGLALSITVGGETMTVDTIGAYAAGIQAFSGVTRSVNTVVKAHSSGDVVNLVKPIHLGL